MKFLVKFEEAIDNLILNFIEKMKKVTPRFVFQGLDGLRHSPQFFKRKLQILAPKLRVFGLKFIGYFQHYLTIVQGFFVGIGIYLKSDEFKKANKVQLALAPIKKFKTDPVKAFSVLMVVSVLGTSSFFIYQNTSKIILGTKALRAPASATEVEEPILEFKKLKYNVLDDKELLLDVIVTATSLEERDKLIPIEKDIEEHLLGIKPHVTQLPLSKEEREAIETEIASKILGAKIKDVEVKQVLEGRPKYFMQTEKMVTLKDLNLQLFLEDTKRNRQVWVDYTGLANNRNTILFLKDHEIEVRDYLNMHVEPVVPQLPVEEEGRQIIKDKIKLELNEFLKANGIEGKILEVYIDYIIVS